MMRAEHVWITTEDPFGGRDWSARRTVKLLGFQRLWLNCVGLGKSVKGKEGAWDRIKKMLYMRPQREVEEKGVVGEGCGDRVGE